MEGLSEVDPTGEVGLDFPFEQGSRGRIRITPA